MSTPTIPYDQLPRCGVCGDQIVIGSPEQIRERICPDCDEVAKRLVGPIVERGEKGEGTQQPLGILNATPEELQRAIDAPPLTEEQRILKGTGQNLPRGILNATPEELQSAVDASRLTEEQRFAIAAHAISVSRAAAKERTAPTISKTTNEDDVARASDGSELCTASKSKGESVATAAGDRAASPAAYELPALVAEMMKQGGVTVRGVVDLEACSRLRRTKWLSVRVDEWVYATEARLFPDRPARIRLARTPQLLDYAARDWAQRYSASFASCYVVVLEWRVDADGTPYFDSGPIFVPRSGCRDDRTAAINCAQAHAKAVARQIGNNTMAWGLHPAREF